MEKRKGSKLGIGITTKDRVDIFNRSYEAWKNFYPESEIVVVDDGSKVPISNSTFRFESPQGIAKSKNVCIDLLLDKGCDELFLVDDDIIPIDSVGLYKYISSPYNHLQLTFQNTYNGVKLTDEMGIEYAEGGFDFNSYSCGLLLYFKKEVFNEVLGFNESFSKWGYEHIDLSLEIYNKGLTPHPFIDVSKSLMHFFSYDYFQVLNSSVEVTERLRLSESNKKLLVNLWRDSTDEKIQKLIRKLSK